MRTLSWADLPVTERDNSGWAQESTLARRRVPIMTPCSAGEAVLAQRAGRGDANAEPAERRIERDEDRIE
jgi:hypothetical protein